MFQIELAEGVILNKAAFEEAFKSNKDDACGELPKAMVTMSWGTIDRLERSLLGNKSNRFKGQAKKAATPTKVNAILGKLFESFSFVFLFLYIICFALVI